MLIVHGVGGAITITVALRTVQYTVRRENTFLVLSFDTAVKHWMPVR